MLIGSLTEKRGAIMAVAINDELMYIIRVRFSSDYNIWCISHSLWRENSRYICRQTLTGY